MKYKCGNHGNLVLCSKVVEICAGGAHSAAITTLGHLYTWGKGRYGRLGHGDYEDQLKPKLVESIKQHRVTQVRKSIFC